MKITIELTDEEIEAILITAGEQGCGYWARTHDSLADVLTQPSGVLVLDSETGKKLGTLTADMCRLAATRMAELVGKHECDPTLLMQLVREPESIDSIAADVFVQCALFGKIVYG